MGGKIKQSNLHPDVKLMVQTLIQEESLDSSEFDILLAGKTTADLSEDSATNLYYTTARVDSDFDTRLATKDTDDVAEGSTNLYYTTARADSDTGAYIAGNRTYGNITTTGYIAGPATLTLDPAAVGDDTGTVVIAGSLQVDGTTTTINSATMSVDDLNITLADGAANAAAANGAGITVAGANATITYDATNDEWDFNKDINVTGDILTNGVAVLTGNQTITLSGDVTGSGTTSISVSLNADTVTSSELSGATQLIIYNSAGTAVKSLYGSGS